MITDIISIIVGLALLFFGGEWLVKGSIGISVKLKISAMLVSLVVIGFGTSAPELLVSLKAAYSGVPEIALGNVIGSNIANILLIIGVAAVLFPVKSGAIEVRRNSIVVIIASLILCIMTFIGSINQIGGSLMLLALISYLTWSYFDEKKRELLPQANQDFNHASEEYNTHTQDDSPKPPKSLWLSLFFTLSGLAGLAAGAELLVNGSVSIAREYNISEAVIGLTLVAVGTSLPELATAIIASLKKHSDVVIGNVLGSNLFNIFFILGTTSLFKELPLQGRIAEIDVWVAFVVAVILYPVIKSDHIIDRKEGAFFLVLYILYTFAMFVFT